MASQGPLRRFITSTAAFALMVAAVLALGEAAVRSLDNPYKTKDRELRRRAALTETLVLGNSHTYFAVRPDMFARPGFSLANVSQTLRLDSALLARYAPMMPRLRTVVLQVGYTSLFDRPMEHTDDWHMIANYVIYMGLPGHSKLSRYGFELTAPATYSAKIQTALGLRRSRLECDSLGHSEAYTTARKYPGWEALGGATVQRHESPMDESQFAANTRVLTGIIAYCRRRGIRTVIVTTPEWATYRAAMDTLRLARINRTVDSLAALPGKPPVVRLDYMADPAFADPALFYDPDHLTTDTGAAAFTRRLVDDAGL